MTTKEFLQWQIRRTDIAIRRAERKPNAPGNELHAPCKDCPERHENCHKSCKKYKAFRAWIDQINQNKAKEFQAIDATIENGKRLNRNFLLNRKKGRTW